MESETLNGYLMLADISGFTAFMADSELEHAHGILHDLLDIIHSHLSPPLHLVEIEGDAVYVCLPTASAPRGEAMLETIEMTYTAFKDRIHTMVLGTTCTCNACRRIPTLDLKFIVHCGDYVLEDLAGSPKPVGSDVNVVHRLSKNHVTEATGWRAYALFTEQALQHMHVQADGMHRQVETYEHLGEIMTYSLDLNLRYQALLQARYVRISPEEADWVHSLELPIPPSSVWEWLISPPKLALWGHTVVSAGGGNGRTGPGLRIHCMHGSRSYFHSMIDYRPFDYFTFETTWRGSNRVQYVTTYQLAPTAGGTRLEIRMRLELAIPKWIKRTFTRVELRVRGELEMLSRLQRAVAA